MAGSRARGCQPLFANVRLKMTTTTTATDIDPNATLAIVAGEHLDEETNE